MEELTMTKISKDARKILKQKAIQADMTMPEYLEFILSDEAIVEKLERDNAEKHTKKVADGYIDMSEIILNGNTFKTENTKATLDIVGGRFHVATIDSLDINILSFFYDKGGIFKDVEMGMVFNGESYEALVDSSNVEYTSRDGYVGNQLKIIVEVEKL